MLVLINRESIAQSVTTCCVRCHMAADRSWFACTSHVHQAVTSCSGLVKAAQQGDLGVNMVPNQQISDLKSICGMCWTSSGDRKFQKEQETNN